MPTAPSLRLLASPELRPQRTFDTAVEDDDEEVAFPTAAHESRYEASDDPVDVYSDFSLIFGVPGDTDDGEDEHSFEEYLDELDGIPCSVR